MNIGRARGSKSRAWSDAEKQQVISQYGKVPLRELAASLGRTPEQVKTAAIQRLGLSSYQLRREDCLARFSALVNINMTDRQIAAVLGVSKSTVQRWREDLPKSGAGVKGTGTVAKADSTAHGQRFYGEEETEFLAAVAAFRSRHDGRPPSLVEGFRIALALGWRKVDEH